MAASLGGLDMRSPITWTKLVVFVYIVHTMWDPLLLLPTTPVAQAVWVLLIVVASSVDLVLAIMLTVALIVSLTAKKQPAAAVKRAEPYYQGPTTVDENALALVEDGEEPRQAEPFKPQDASHPPRDVDEGENLFPYPEAILEPRLADAAELDKDIQKMTEVSRRQLMNIQTNALVAEMVDKELDMFQPVDADLVLEVSPLAKMV